MRCRAHHSPLSHCPPPHKHKMITVELHQLYFTRERQKWNDNNYARAYTTHVLSTIYMIFVRRPAVGDNSSSHAYSYLSGSCTAAHSPRLLRTLFVVSRAHIWGSTGDGMKPHYSTHTCEFILCLFGWRLITIIIIMITVHSDFFFKYNNKRTKRITNDTLNRRARLATQYFHTLHLHKIRYSI